MPRPKQLHTRLVLNYEARAAWLQLRAHPLPVFVMETDTGFIVGACRNTGRARKRIEPVLAGFFTVEISFEDFHDAVEAAAAEAVELGRAAA